MRPSPLAITALAGLLLATSAARAANDPVTGAWLVRGKVGSFAFTLTCDFQRRGEDIGGVCFDGGTHKAHPLTQGHIAGTRISWTYQSSFMFKPFDAAYSGEIDKDAIKGSITVPGHTGVFTAARQS